MTTSMKRQLVPVQFAGGMAKGKTHASSVLPVAKCNDGESLILTHPLVPLKVSAPPNLPEVVQLGPMITPTFPFADESPALVPVPSSNPYL